MKASNLLTTGAFFAMFLEALFFNLIWNHVIADKFGFPHFTYLDSVAIMIIVGTLFPTSYTLGLSLIIKKLYREE